MKQWNIYSTKKRKRQPFFSGVEYKAYDKEYPDEALDNDDYDKKNDEIDFIEKIVIMISMYILMM